MKLEHIGKALMKAGTFTPVVQIDRDLPEREAARYMRFLLASANAFDSAAKKLDVNAVELAERMQNGGIATLAECLRDVLSRFHSCIADGNGQIKGDEEAMGQAGQILDKVKGDAP